MYMGINYHVITPNTIIITRFYLKFNRKRHNP